MKETAEAGEEKMESNRGGKDTEATSMEASNWVMVVELVQTAFSEGRLAEEAMWQAVVLLHKGGKDYRATGLVEVMWKVVAKILNLRLIASITFHGFLHGFGRVAAQVPPLSGSSCFSI